MQLAAFPMNLPGPLMQALGDLDAMPDGARALGEQGDFWMRLAIHLQGLEQVAEALPEELDAEGLAAWLAASLGNDEALPVGRPLPQDGKNLPPQAALMQVATGSADADTADTEHLSGAARMREHLMAAAVQAAAMSADDEIVGKRALSVIASQGKVADIQANMANAISLETTQAAAATRTTPRQLSLDIPMGQPGWDRSLGDRVQWMVNQKVQVAELRLNPPSLGPIEIRVQVDGDRTQVNFVAPQAAVREAIDAALPRLREMFAEGGMTLDVSVSHQDARQARGESDGQGAGGGTQAGEGADQSGVPGEAQAARQGHGLVDYYA
ncbi:flagellar hook-length control protein FliK [Thioalkalivibrio sulfidiphilus]|uniref:flagellar hook-length control protein FliK n=1 Tax=Thioalkalivibrio sulfidiphilus TaxID=1033854 RepID=UPI00039F7BFB|nr:flagellar hook-length control protein FliK [Thioalkalivibrio sulfidiphilus]